MSEISFCEMREKIVINVIDGKRLGHILDLSINLCGKIIGIILPAERKIFRGFVGGDTIYIPWRNIVKIGEDAILVELIAGIECCERDRDRDRDRGRDGERGRDCDCGENDGDEH